MWNLSGTSDRPLTFEEYIFVAEQTVYISVEVQRSMPSIHSPLFGTIGPFQAGNKLNVPLYAVNDLVNEHIAYPILPNWLKEENLKVIFKEEMETEELQPCPHSAYLEILTLLFETKQLPWPRDKKSQKEKKNVMFLIDNLVQRRRQKINKLNDALIENGIIDSSNLSRVERTRLGSPAAEFCKTLKEMRVTSTDNLTDLLTQLGVQGVNAHAEYLSKARKSYKSMLNESSLSANVQSSSQHENWD